MKRKFHARFLGGRGRVNRLRLPSVFMHALWIILTCLAGTFAFGFLLAGILGCADFDRFESPASREDRVLLVIDAVLFGALGFLASGVAKNWSKQRDARRFVYAGLISLSAVAVFGYLVVRTG